MKNKVIDVAFLPVDPRLEENDILALDYMLKIVKVKQVFPMHFWEKYSIYEDIPNQYREIVVPIHHTNELFLIEEDY